MPQVTYQASQFDQGMTPKVFDHNAVTRIEHFDTITDVLRPFRTLELCGTSGLGGQAVSGLALSRFASISGVIYGLGVDYVTPANPAIYQWNGAARDWETKWGFAVGKNLANNLIMIAHAAALFGIGPNGGGGGNYYIWKMTTAGVYTDQFSASLGSVVNVADPIVHSKDGVAYFPYDNKIWKLTSAGADGGIALTLPNTNFRITSICEQGNYINIVGFDSITNQSSSLLWDRDTSVVDLTESYALGPEQVWHNANLLGNTFFIQIRSDSNNTSNFVEQPVIVIKTLSGAVPKTLSEFPVSSYVVGGKWVSNDRLYFTARVKFIGESAARNIVFCLDAQGRLTVAQNASINTGTNTVTGIYREGEGFWLGAGSDGTWTTTSTYTTIAAFETTDTRAGRYFRGRWINNFDQNLDFIGGVVTCEPLPAAGQILVKMRKNEETTYTTVATLTGANISKFSLTPMKVKNALTGLDKARLVRCRLESTGGAVITGFQAVFNEVADDTV